MASKRMTLNRLGGAAVPDEYSVPNLHEVMRGAEAQSSISGQRMEIRMSQNPDFTIYASRSIVSPSTVVTVYVSCSIVSLPQIEPWLQ